MDAIPALPPLHVETFGQGRVRDGILLTGAGEVHPWLVGQGRQCDARTPGGRYLTGFGDFPEGCDALSAQRQVALVFETNPRAASMWFDGLRPAPGMPDPGSPVLSLAGGSGPGDAALEAVDGFEGRVLRVRTGSATPLRMEFRGTEEGDLAVAAREGTLACLMRPDGNRDRFWTTLPCLGLVGAYWLYAVDQRFSPMACLVRRIMAERPAGPVPAAEAVVVAHAGAVMRYLGKEYREEADAFSARCHERDLDVEVIRWSFLADAGDRDGYERWTREISGRLLHEPLAYSASLRLALERLPSASDVLAERGSPVADVAREAGRSVSRTACRTHWDHPMITTLDGEAMP